MKRSIVPKVKYIIFEIQFMQGHSPHFAVSKSAFRSSRILSDITLSRWADSWILCSWVIFIWISGTEARIIRWFRCETATTKLRWADLFYYLYLTLNIFGTLSFSRSHFSQCTYILVIFQDIVEPVKTMILRLFCETSFSGWYLTKPLFFSGNQIP